MKIVVCIKQVPDTTEIKLDPVKGTLIRDGVPSIMNPDDKCALEAALKLKDRHNDTCVTVITMGPPQAEAILREAFAMGADEAVLVTDRKFGGADTWATSYTLSQALKTLEYDLIIAGRQAIDGDTAQVGPQIAEQLNLPQITYVEEVDFIGNNTLSVRKVTEDGNEFYEVEMPCMLTCLSSAGQPRYMRVGGILNAFKKEIKVLTTAEIQVDPEKIGLKGSPTNVKKAFTKGAKAMGTLHEELTPEEAANLIFDKLKEKFII